MAPFALPEVLTQMLLTKIPMPPSMNHAYATVEIEGVHSRVKGAKMRAFERDMATWALANMSDLRRLREIVRNRFIRIDADFWFERSAVLTKDGKPKRNDTSNRLKALHDQLAELLGVDDCWFWDGSYRRSILPVSAQFEYVNVEVSLL